MLQILAIGLSLSLGVAAQSATAVRTDQEALVLRFVDAFNAHDVEAMAAIADDGIQWVTIDGARVSVETDGKTALRTILQRYFAQCPTCRSTLEWTRVSGSRVAARERASWTTAAGPRTQTSLSVYELKDGKILRVLYFPVEKD
jgi:hypothetical protein